MCGWGSMCGKQVLAVACIYMCIQMYDCVHSCVWVVVHICVCKMGVQTYGLDVVVYYVRVVCDDHV